MNDVTRILERIERGEPGSAEELASRVYAELHAMAEREMARERPDHTLQATALVNEAFLRLVPATGCSFESRAHFFGASASAIRRVLVDHARRRARLKRDATHAPLTPDVPSPTSAIDDNRLIDLDDALAALAENSASLAKLVELRFFAGMTLPEVAMATGVSEATVARRWRVARAWLAGQLGDAHDS